MTYQGPENLVDDMQIALEVLEGALKVSIDPNATHMVYSITGLTGSQAITDAIGVYLVGAVSAYISWTLRIRSALFPNVSGSAGNIYADVVRLIGDSNTLSENERRTHRDPWLWEGISHLLFHLARHKPAWHPPGSIIAKTYIHLDPKDHGLDLIAIYGPNPMGLSIGECKAYLKRPGDAIDDAATRLSELDGTSRDGEVRGFVSQVLESLPEEVQGQLMDGFWKNERAYFPMVCCDQPYELDWNRSRAALARLQVTPDHKLLVPASIPQADDFFDAVANSMRRYANSTKTR